MFAAIRTTILSSRSCALTGSVITSRRRRNSTRGPLLLVHGDRDEVVPFAESAKLQALQIKQQLGAQALSIANSAPQTVLSLFR